MIKMIVREKIESIHETYDSFENIKSLAEEIINLAIEKTKNRDSSQKVLKLDYKELIPNTVFEKFTKGNKFIINFIYTDKFREMPKGIYDNENSIINCHCEQHYR